MRLHRPFIAGIVLAAGLPAAAQVCREPSFRPGGWVLDPEGSPPTIISDEDVNGDGRPDLLVYRSSDFTASVEAWVNDGAGGFTRSFVLDSGPETYLYAAAADMNGDGLMDLVVAEQGVETRLVVRFNDGAGGFAEAHEYPVEVWMSLESPFCLDINGDGLADVMYFKDQALKARLNRGGVLGPEIDAAPAVHPYEVTLADLNGDGRLELIGSVSWDLRYWTDDGTGRFAQATVVSPQEAYVVQAVDVNGDGRIDLTAIGTNDSFVHALYRVWLNDGDGRFTEMEPVSVPTHGGYVHSPLYADLDGDGDLELVLHSWSTGGIRVFINEGGSFGPPVSYAAPAARGMTATDLDGDRRTDLVWVNSVFESGGHRADIVFMRGLGAGQLAPPRLSSTPVGVSYFVGLHLADIDGDGRRDALLNSRASFGGWSSWGGLYLMLGRCACSADFNGDGQVDFFDYLDFVAAFAADDPSADFNGDGQVDFFDYLDFVAAFADGC